MHPGSASDPDIQDAASENNDWATNQLRVLSPKKADPNPFPQAKLREGEDSAGCERVITVRARCGHPGKALTRRGVWVDTQVFKERLFRPSRAWAAQKRHPRPVDGHETRSWRRHRDPQAAALTFTAQHQTGRVSNLLGEVSDHVGQARSRRQKIGLHGPAVLMSSP